MDSKTGLAWMETGSKEERAGKRGKESHEETKKARAIPHPVSLWGSMPSLWASEGR